MRILCLFFLTLILLSSCKIETEVYINKDGSGSQIDIVDISMGSMMGMMGDMEGVNEGAKDPDELAQEEKIEFDLKKFMDNPGSMGKVDTAFVVYDAISDSLRNSPDGDLFKKIHMNIRTSKEGYEMFLKSKMNYDNQQEKQTLGLKKIETFMAGQKDQDIQDGMAKNLLTTTTEIIDYKKGIVIIPSVELGDELGKGMGAGELDMEDDGAKSMLTMMLGDSGLKSTYHLPGPVEFTNDSKAIINGNSVTFNIPILDLLEIKTIPKRIIKYKS